MKLHRSCSFPYVVERRPRVRAPRCLTFSEVLFLFPPTPGAEPPAGCGVAHVSAACQVHVLLKGVVDAAAEIKKAAKKLAGARKKIASFETRMGTAVYAEKVPAAQKAKDAAKLAELKKEAADLAKAQAAFEDLKE